MFRTNVLTTNFLIFFCAGLFAQSNTIMVTVNDTIMVPANRITIAISFKDTAKTLLYEQYGSDMEPATEPNENPDQDNTQLKPGEPDLNGAFEKVKAILTQNGISWRKTMEQMGGLFGGLANLGQKDTAEASRNITIDFNSKAQLDAVLPKIKAVTFAETLEMGASVDEGTVSKKVLYEKLLKKARAKATEIATLAGKRVGDIHQIGNPYEAMSPEKYMESMTGGGGLFGNMFKMMGNMFSEKNPDYKVAVKESMTVTFFLM
jgi:hypothetical protein